jgi:hypothetical protein
MRHPVGAGAGRRGAWHHDADTYHATLTASITHCWRSRDVVTEL